jgi:glycine cleavage system aminomethyltransferase T
MAIDWVRFHLETEDYDATAEMDENSLLREGPPKLFRYELQGPTAVPIVEKLIGGPVPEIRFFSMGTLVVAGLEVRALRHGMAGQPGYELFGPWKDGEPVREAILAAGEEFGLVQAGARAYSTANLESGWVPSPCPAIFDGESSAAYRRWLPVERAGSLGGSIASDDIRDYYVTPYDLGYGRSVAFDHDFVGREALERLRESLPRQKVTLVWNADDVTAAIGTIFNDGDKAKHFELPKSRYALYQCDAVLVDATRVGISHDCGYITNENAFVSLASVENEHAEPGTGVTVIWGEEPNSSKPAVEPHVQVEIRATVAPAPYVDFARRDYRSN